MKMDLEHDDICKALSYYLSKAKGFQVDCNPALFQFKELDDGTLEVAIKGGDMNVPPPAWLQALEPKRAQGNYEPMADLTPPARAPSAPAPVAAPRKAPPMLKPPKNSMLTPQPPGSPAIPKPKVRDLDGATAALSSSDAGEGYVEDASGYVEDAPVSTLKVDTTELSPEEADAVADILRRSRIAAQRGPDMSAPGTDASDEPL